VLSWDSGDYYLAHIMGTRVQDLATRGTTPFQPELQRAEYITRVRQSITSPYSFISGPF
jgi:hypothetical protein